MKNVDPYTPSAIVNGASTYSNPWNPVNTAASTTVIMIPTIVPRRFPWISEWCAYVTDAPEDRRIIVLSRGIS